MGIETAIGVGASLVGGMMGDDASGDAAGMQSASAAQAINEIRKIGARTRSDTEPYRGLGLNSVNKLNVLLGLGGTAGGGKNYAETPMGREEFIDFAGFDRPKGDRPEGPEWLDHENANIDRAYANYLRGLKTVDATTDPEYNSLLRGFTEQDLTKDVVYNKGLEFGLNEGNKAIERNATRFGNLDSGATLKALTRFGNDYGETKAAGAHNRFMGDKAFTLGSLMGTTGVGQWGVGLDASTGANMAQAIGGAQMASGNAQAAGRMGGANAWSDALGGISNALGGAGRGFGSIFGGKSSYVPEYSAGGIDLTRYFA